MINKIVHFLNTLILVFSLAFTLAIAGSEEGTKDMLIVGTALFLYVLLNFLATSKKNKDE